MWFAAIGRRWSRLAGALSMTLAISGAASALGAQTAISVPFTSGFLGTRGTSAGTANNVLTFATLEIARVFFIQSSSTSTFEIQGNDIPGTMRIVRTNGTILDLPASANWRNSGGTTYLIGYLPRPTSPITLTYGGGSIQITDGAVNGGSSIGGYAAAYAGTKLADGESTNGNAALSQVLAGLNDYLATVIASRPPGPVTVTAVSTSSSTPTITGTATVGAGEVLTVVVNGVQYSTSTSPAIVRSGNTWSLSLTTPLATGTYDVAATITNTDGFTLSDTSTNELTITPVTSTVTIGGSFTAANKVYSGNTLATGSTSGLTLVGVNGSDNVTIASVTLSFLTAPAGTAKTVVITGVTLGGTDAALYTVSLTAAPTATADITPKPLTIGGTFTASHKVFDGTTAATIATNSLTLVGVVSPDVVTLSTTTAAFATAAVANGKTVSLTAATLGGTDIGNYAISVAGAPTTTANITSAGGTVTIGGSFTANDKVYNGTTSATGNTSGLTLVGITSPDQVTIASVTIGFTTASVGAAKTVVITGVTLAGSQANLYTVTLAGAPTTTASITPIQLTIGGSFVANEKIFDGNTSVIIRTSALALVGILGGDNVTLTGVTYAFSNPAVGAQRPVAITGALLGGSSAANYSLSLVGAPAAAADILAATPPSVPRAVAGVAGDGRITLTFEIPASEGCRDVSGYAVESSTDNGATWQRTLLDGRTLSSWVLPNLTNNVPTRVRVAAVNACGLSAFVEVQGPFVPIGPTRTAGGQPTTTPRGTGTLSASNTPVTLEVVRDTLLRLSDGTVTLTLRTSDAAGSALPVDSSRTLQLDQGGRATTEGSGFAPGTYVSVFIYAPNGAPILLGTVVVGIDGTFRATLPIPASLPPGDYTLQVNGIDRTHTPRSASLGVEVAEPPADIELTAVPDQSSPTIGDTITITLTVLNKGTGAAINVIIPRAFTESGFAIVKATPIDGTYNDFTKRWTIPRIEPGARARLLLTAIVLPPAAPQPNTP